MKLRSIPVCHGRRQRPGSGSAAPAASVAEPPAGTLQIYHRNGRDTAAAALVDEHELSRTCGRSSPHQCHRRHREHAHVSMDSQIPAISRKTCRCRYFYVSVQNSNYDHH
ncbi:transient receptor potential cation channelsubfamily c member 5b [Striga asiatica]|uniref:Transient receptor potential cation channelsubfamily c member 5b n=1 Tax=Striga asiatica TaxID=4170 RepID=A0A5A7RIU3_STRAF|nr:transient receptor potential cation channelsubfamily c member 5b [Striga asiatica]